MSRFRGRYKYIQLSIQIMKEKRKEYPIKQIRMSEETWKKFKEKKIVTGKTWNLFIKKLIDEL